MREIRDHAELVALCAGDTVCRWAAQVLTGGVRAFAAEDGAAVAVASPALSLRDRLAVHGRPRAPTALVREAPAEVGRTHRPVGDRTLTGALLAEPAEPRPVAAFGWMEAGAPRAQ